MGSFIKKNIVQIIVVIVGGLVILIFTAWINAVNEKIDSKASKEEVEISVLNQEKDIELIKNDVNHLIEQLDTYHEDNKERLDKIDQKIDRLIEKN